jgi:hypothetical protein
MREVHLYEYSSFTIRHFRFALCAVCPSLGRKYWCVCVCVCVRALRFYCCFTT